MLDQTAIAFGGLKKLDFADKNKICVTNVDNTLSDYTFVLINTGGSHANLTDEYASIPQEMKAVANCFGKERLVDISKEEFFEGLPKYIDKLYDGSIPYDRMDRRVFRLIWEHKKIMLERIEAMEKSSRVN